MPLDLILKRANLPDGRSGVDIGIEDGRIVELRPQLDAAAKETVDCSGRLVTPPFVDSHFHMDATLSLGIPRLNRSGTLLEGIALWGELKPMLTEEAVIERALASATSPWRKASARSAAMSTSATTGSSACAPCSRSGRWWHPT